MSIARRFGGFLSRQIFFIRHGGPTVFITLFYRYLFFCIGLVPAFIFVIVIRLISPFFVIRIHQLISSRIGHLTANTELYICEIEAGINTPDKPFLDLIYFGAHRICNEQLANMWRRKLCIGPKWILEPAFVLNRIIPGGKVNIAPPPTQFGRDIHNLFEKSECHIDFTPAEDEKGKAELHKMGIPEGSEFICLNVRDDLYLNKVIPVETNWVYHNYRDSNIENFLLAAETLAEMGYYVIRMGVVVKEPIKSNHPKVIDYAYNGMRNDFMDIYLGAKCLFCLSTGSGFDGIPLIFRRPIAYANIVPLGYIESYVKNSLFLSKHHICSTTGKMLREKEIFERGVGFCLSSDGYTKNKVELIENTPQEISDFALEMLSRLKGTWVDQPSDESLQNQFWENFPLDAVNESNGLPIHGRHNGRYSTNFLRMHPEWVQ
jgi:putative glycosyltransferase (TIGR04372 family)